MNKIRSDIEPVRKEFSKRIQEYKKKGGRYIEYAHELSDDLLNNCKVHASLNSLIGCLPKAGVGAVVLSSAGPLLVKALGALQTTTIHAFSVDPTCLDSDEYKSNIRSGQITVHPGNPAQQLKEQAHFKFDWAYIEPGIDYKSTRSILENISNSIKDGGIIIIKDYCIWSVGSMRPVGIARAVSEFSVRERWAYAHIVLQPSSYHYVALQKLIQ